MLDDIGSKNRVPTDIEPFNLGVSDRSQRALKLVTGCDRPDPDRAGQRTPGTCRG
jgi:hypothetical protein